jgi:hypothetical protein
MAPPLAQEEGAPAAISSIEGLSGDALTGVAQIWKKQGRSLTARFGGSSMLPTLPAGAELTFLCGGAVDVGDVAVVVHRGRILVHRVVARSEAGRWVLTRGDGTWVPDPPTLVEQVVGRVTAVRKGPDWIAPPPAPASRWRRLPVAVCAWSLGVSEAAGRRLIALLWAGRYWLQLAPAAVRRRLRGGRASSPKEQE